jgi:hypothetical protein
MSWRPVNFISILTLSTLYQRPQLWVEPLFADELSRTFSTGWTDCGLFGMLGTVLQHIFI